MRRLVQRSMLAIAAVTLGLGTFATSYTTDRLRRPRPGAPVPTGQIQARAAEAFARAPLYFEANRGQTDPQVQFLSRGPNYQVFLASTEAVYVLFKPETRPAARVPAAESPASRRPEPAPNRLAGVVRMRLRDAQAEPKVVGLDELPGRVNYFKGNDPRKWHTNIPIYAKVRYENVYPGIALEYYGQGQQLEYDFVVAPGADPSRIAMEFVGADSLAVDASGDLVVRVAGMAFRHRRPLLYQEANGTRQEVAGGYVVGARGRVGFRVEAHDPGRPLVIDPVACLHRYFNSTGNDDLYGIALDASGGSYRAALASFSEAEAEFLADTTPGCSGGFASFESIAANGLDIPTGVSVDGSGNAYFAGSTTSTNFPTTPGAWDSSFNGGVWDAFVVKRDSSNNVVYVTYLGGSGVDQVFGIRVDSAGNAHVTGRTQSGDFPTTVGAWDTTHSGGIYDAFIAKLNPTGSAFFYSTFLGGSDLDQAYGIALDASGNVYVTGATRSTDFPITPGVVDSTCGGCTSLNSEAFVTKLDTAGSNTIYSTYLGGGAEDGAQAIAVDGVGNAYITGFVGSADFPTTPGAWDATHNGAYDAFATKLNATATGLVYSTLLGGNGVETGYGIAVDGQGNVYVTGDTGSANFPVASAWQPNLASITDAFVTKVNPTGATLRYSSYLGTAGTDVARGVAVDAAGTAFVGGSFPSRFPGATDSEGRIYKIAPAGVDSAGLYNPATGTFYLRNTSDGGPANLAFTYGPGSLGWIPLVGDWNGDGTKTVGVYDPGTGVFHLRNTNTAGPADLVFAYGPGGLGWIPLAGDWNADGIDTVGLYNPTTSTFYLRNTNTAGPADVVVPYGPPAGGWMPITGDWDGNGTRTVGLYNPATGTFYLRNSNTSGAADLAFAFGPGGANWVPVTGDWDANATTTIGAYDPAASVFHLRNANAAGPADVAYGYGPAGLNWTPRGGDWDGL